MPINQVAHNVGYSEHSDLNHAFNRLTSLRPQSVKKSICSRKT